MIKIISVLLCFGIIFFSACGKNTALVANSDLNNKCLQGPLDIKYDIAFVGNQPCYIDTKNSAVGFNIDRTSYARKEGVKIPAAMITFSLRNKKVVVAGEICKSGVFLSDLGSWSYYHHEVINNISFISSDGSQWEPIKMKLITDKKEKSLGHHVVVMQLFLECSFFKGNYSIIEEGEE